jgi:hypothetical protein
VGVEVDAVAPRLDVPGAVFPGAGGGSGDAEVGEDGVFAGGGEGGPGLGGPVGGGLDRVPEFHGMAAVGAGDVPDRGAPAVDDQAVGRGAERVEYGGREVRGRFERTGPSDPDPAWARYFDEPKLVADIGIAHSRLGEAATAEPLIEDALRREDQGNMRGRAFHTLWLARTQLVQGKLDQACHTATRALGPASSVTSERVSGHLTEFYEQLTPHRTEPAVVDFKARVRALFPQVSGWPRP